MRKLTLFFVAASFGLSSLLVWMPDAWVKADGTGIVGTWIVTTTPNVPPGSPPLSYAELVSFNPGGTLVDTHAITHASELPFLPAAVAVDSSDAFGVWQQLGGESQFVTTHKRLLFAGPNTPSALYGSAFLGQHVGFETVQTVLTQTGVDGPLSGAFTVEYANLGGEIVFADSGVVSMKRVNVQPLARP